MKIAVLGAGAIGSLFGGLLSLNNDVTLIGRKEHVSEIMKNGLRITGKTNLIVCPKAVYRIEGVNEQPDILIVAVKSYDTESAIREAVDIVGDKTIVLSLQNGIDNIPRITSYIEADKVLAGITTEAVTFLRAGTIEHTGKGLTLIGEINGRITSRLKKISEIFNSVGLTTKITENIWDEIWSKAIINSCINPITAVFDIKNGEIIKHPILYSIAETICRESTKVAVARGIEVSEEDTLKKLRQVIENTSENYSSMVQSLRKRKPTEIDSINGIIVKEGKKKGIDTSINELFLKMVKIRETVEVKG